MYQKLVLISLCWAASITYACAQTPCVDGQAEAIKVINGIPDTTYFPCDEVSYYTHLTPAELGQGYGGSCNDIWGWVDPASGREFALVGMTTGTAFVDITNPFAPEIIGFLPSASNASGSAWRDMKVNDHYMYVVTEQIDHGIQIFDLHRLPDVSSPPVVFNEDAHFDFRALGGRAHNIVQFPEIDYMVLVGARENPACAAGLEFVDVSDPYNPVLTGCYAGDGYTHDAVCFIYRGPDSEHIGKEICIASNETVQSIVDITQKDAAVRLSNVSYYNPDTLPSGSSRKYYTHQCWPSEDQRFIFFNDELDELRNEYTTRTHVMNIENLDSAFYIGFYDHGTTTIDHNCYVKGNYIYASNYESGLRILNYEGLADDPQSQIHPSGYFDTYPQAQSRNFGGSWSNYPYFPSGVIAVSDRFNGLFLLSQNQDLFTIQMRQTLQKVCAGDDLIITIITDDYGSSPGNVTLSVDGLPMGASAVFTNPTIGSADSTTLTISGLPAVEQKYSIEITGMSTGGATFQGVFAFATISAYPATASLDNVILTQDTSIIVTQTLTLNSISIAAGKQLNITSPQLLVNGNIKISNGSTFYWIEENVCAQE